MTNGHREQSEQVGGLAGLGAGVLAGAAAGSAVMPVVGTFTGALLGGLVGSELGKSIGGAILEAFSSPQSSSCCHSEPCCDDEPHHDCHHGSGQCVASDVIVQLERLGQMRADGIITEEEFKAAKSRLLGI